VAKLVNKRRNPLPPEVLIQSLNPKTNKQKNQTNKAEPPLEKLLTCFSLRDAKNKVLLATCGAKILKGGSTRGFHGGMG
jgi:hypothetical protein